MGTTYPTWVKVEKSLKLRTHNIDGFNWGHETKGALQLALAVCLEIYPQNMALEIYRDFQEEFLISIQDDSFFLSISLYEFNKRCEFCI